jgi:hypothetical protein
MATINYVFHGRKGQEHYQAFAPEHYIALDKLRQGK